MKEPPSKRPRIVRGDDDYMPGNIIEIELHNFMTFSHLTCKPGPRLNLVIGPNGSGKSSLVCAIALGLVGEPSLLGRATSVGAYVKRGEESGYTKITLRGATKEERITIMRKMDARNKSEWLLNGKVVPKKDIADITKRFNIQVSNLTQFLPQDRVCEFAKLSPVELLEETEKAVGDPQLPIRHRALIEKSKEVKNLERAIETNEKTLDQHKAYIAEQQREVERVRQREQLLVKAETMKKKVPWLKYDMMKAEYLEAKEKEKDAKKKLDEAAKLLKNLEEPIVRKKKEKGNLNAKVEKMAGRIDVNAQKRITTLGEAESWGVKVQGSYEAMENLKRDEESRQQRILKAKEELAAAELELENMPPYEPPKDEIETLRSQISDLHVSAAEKRRRKQEKEKLLFQKNQALKEYQHRLKQIQGKNMKLLQALKSSGSHKIFEAYDWVQSHREDFKKEVYGPVLLEVNVPEQIHTNYLEGHVPSYIWKSFITQDPHDRDLLVKNLKSFGVPTLNYVAGKHFSADPYQISEQMRELGICSRLDQVFDAPFAVREVLTSQCRLDKSYIGSKETDLKADEVSKLGIFDCWTPENHYRWSRSRYGGHVAATVDTVVPSRLFLCSLDVKEIERLNAKIMELEEDMTSLEGSVRSLQSEQRHIDDEAARLEKEREEIIKIAQHESRKRREMQNRIDQKKQKLKSLEKEDDLDTRMAGLIDQCAKYNESRFKCVMKFKDLVVESVMLRQTLAINRMAVVEFDAKIRELEVNFKLNEKSSLQATMHYEDCKNAVRDCQEKLSAAKRHAESVAVLTPELGKEFLEMPTTIEELEAAIQDNISQANAIFSLNRNVLEEYEHRQRQIAAVSTKLEADRLKLQMQKDEIEELKESWLPTLRNLVAQINETFSRNFQEMAVAGEVSLEEHDMDFEQFGILIKVKFRQAGELKVLSAHHQSGGERSVSTILYLVSLQDLTHCPFRVVDEINQGMDPINERKMFQQLVRAASQPNTPQCFLLTPKLLPELEYSEACSILNIMNGPWIEQPSEAWSGGECWRNVARVLA
ncbi:structural maintenance of chromosomes protein 5 isoform X2 [Humulus lupulus]|uniref:structural maintenance of chromosomes protein 5 isoform X2 n=1 Tax=Humulus lupulus TaxID=3486 RepID=UPI002B40E3AB|nr:structural maintenance of chromosomes protein 5 isoform X2 [Humulus lupulus]